MKKILLIFLSITLAVIFSVTPIMAKKAGEVKDDVYTDKDYGFSFRIPPGWSSKVSSDKKPDRIALTQKSYPVPRAFQGGNEDFAQIPMIIVLADTTSFEVDEFVDKLLDPEYETKQFKYFMKKLRLISKPHDEGKRKEVTVQGAKTITLEARQQYTIEVPQIGSDRADVVTDFKSGAVFFTVRDGHVIIIHMISEYQFNLQYLDLFYKLTGSLKFKEAEQEKK